MTAASRYDVAMDAQHVTPFVSTRSDWTELRSYRGTWDEPMNQWFHHKLTGRCNTFPRPGVERG